MKSFAIIGGGATAVLVAAQILESSPDTKVGIFDPAPALGIGIAYGTENLDHLLNVFASGMSARPDDPDHFLDWLKTQTRWRPAEGISARTFAPRRIYRDYLQDLLAPWCQKENKRLVHHRAIVTDVDPGMRSARIRTSGGVDHVLDFVILATGNGAGPSDMAAPTATAWSGVVAGDIPPGEAVVILGTGLSMVDSVITLLGSGHVGPITAISRRGLLPRPHPETPTSPSGAITLPQDRTLGGLMAWFRTHRRSTEGDWRALVDSIRPETQSIWAEFTTTEKRRFLRHARAWWDVHRHRMAPSIHAMIAEAQARGQLRILAAKVMPYREADGTLTVRSRMAEEPQQIHADHVIDCRGQAGPGSMSESPLLTGLIRRGVSRPAIAGLGIEVAANCAVIDAKGLAQDRLFAVGPPTIGTFWETVAIPDIRVQARDLALRLTDRV